MSLNSANQKPVTQITTEPQPVEPLLSINKLIELLGSRSTAYGEINAGRLKTIKVKSRRYSTPNQWREYLKLLEKEAEENFQDQLPKPKKKTDKEAAA